MTSRVNLGAGAKTNKKVKKTRTKAKGMKAGGMMKAKGMRMGGKVKKK